MKPQEKAEQLVDLYYPIFTHSMAIIDAKKCALIAVDELIKQCDDSRDYWQQVKQEINKINNF